MLQIIGVRSYLFVSVLIVCGQVGLHLSVGWYASRLAAIFVKLSFHRWLRSLLQIVQFKQKILFNKKITINSIINDEIADQH